MVENYPIAYSEVSGIMTPQSMETVNKNITTAFKGPMTTHIYLDLTPTSYVSEPDSYSYTGYRSYYKDVERGSIVNKWTMLLQYTPDLYENKGFNIEMVCSTTNKIYQVWVIWNRTLIEICAFILGSIAGFVFIAWTFKYCLEDIEYFKTKDRECDMLFGSAL